MRTAAGPSGGRRASTVLLVLAVGCVALPSHALYKVVGPDGRVTYTDTPPAAASGSKVTRLGPGAPAGDDGLPFELRQATQRFPVTLYTMKVCEPCDAARAMLRQRGVPFSERLVLTGDDADALARVSGGRDTPTVAIGGQILRGYAAETWTSYLDSAGYPRESRLPASYQFPAARPVVEPPAAVAAPAPAASARPTAPAPAPEPQAVPAAGGFRF